MEKLDEHIKFAPLRLSDLGIMKPECKDVLGNSDCLRKNIKGKCPSNCSETGECIGWAPKKNPTDFK